MNKNLEEYLPDGNKAQYRFMKYRIHKILLVCCSYDGYILEEDGHIESQINQEYLDLNMSNPPSFTRVSSTREALELLGRDDSFDFILTMYNVGELDVFSFAKIVKERHAQIPVALLTSFSKDIYRRLEEQDRSGLDYIFGWHGNTDLIMAIIKLVEDKMNAEEDITDGGVQAILLVEDSIRFYSTYLPELYKLILLQNTEFLKDAFNEQQQILRKRARPKILLATNYEEAVELYDRYKKNILGVISDVGFVLHRNDPPESEKRDAGIDLCRRIKADNPLMPVLLQSSQTEFEVQARQLGAGFIAKNSKTLLTQLHEYIDKEFAFGEFLFKDPDTGAVIGKAKDLVQMQEMIATIPDKAFEYHTSQNHLSKWLYSRGLFPLAAAIRRGNKSQFASTQEHRQRIVNLIKDYRTLLGQGVVARFDPETYSDAVAFARIGEGSLGGKARGLAFMNSMILKHRLYDKHANVRIVNRYLNQGGGSVGVTASLVDDYLTIDGKPFVGDERIEAKKVFGNELQPTLRDPRLSQTVCMPGQQLRPDDKAPYYVVPPLIGTSSYNQNMTGYSLLKHVQIDYTGSLDAEFKGATPAIQFRYADILLNYAEALAELDGVGNAQKIIDALQPLRDRVGMPPVDFDREYNQEADYGFRNLDKYIQAVRRERRVEKACEGRRQEDIMRWAAADELIVGKWPKGALFVGSNLENHPVYGDKLIYDQASGNNLFLTGKPGDPLRYIIPTNPAGYESGWKFNVNRDYLLPIQTRMLGDLTGGMWEQNPGW